MQVIFKGNDLPFILRLLPFVYRNSTSGRDARGGVCPRVPNSGDLLFVYHLFTVCCPSLPFILCYFTCSLPAEMRQYW